MSRRYVGHDGLFLIIFVFALAGFLIWDRWKRRQNETKHLPITRWRMLWIAVIRRFLWVGILAAVLTAMLLCMHVFGAMRTGALLGSLCALALMLGLCMLQPANVLARCTRLLRSREVDIEALLSGKCITRTGGFWTYADDDWYIRLGGGSCAVLYAPLIDFDGPNQFHYWNTGEKSTNSYMFEFMGRDGSRYCALHPLEQGFRDWLGKCRRKRASSK